MKLKNNSVFGMGVTGNDFLHSLVNMDNRQLASELSDQDTLGLTHGNFVYDYIKVHFRTSLCKPFTILLLTLL